MVTIAIQLLAILIVSKPGCMDPTQMSFITDTASLREVRDKSLLGDMYSDDDYELSMMSLHHADWAISSTTLAIMCHCCCLFTCAIEDVPCKNKQRFKYNSTEYVALYK